MRQLTKTELEVLINGKISDLSASKFSKFDAYKINQLTIDIRHYILEWDNLDKLDKLDKLDSLR